MANKIYLVRETPVIFRTGGSNKNFSIVSLGSGTGWRSERIDLGAGSTPYRFEWRAYFQLNSTIATIDGSQTLDLYVITSDASHPDGGFASTEGSISSTQKRFNMKQIGNVVVDSTSDTSFTASGKFEVYSRYFSIALFNFSGVTLSATQANNGVDVTPLVEEIQ